MTIQEAIEQGQPLIAAWDESRSNDAWLGVYALPLDRAPVLLAHEQMPPDDRARRTVELRGKGVRVGATARGPAIWAIDDGFDLWQGNGQHVVATREAVHCGGRVVAAKDVASVTTFVDDSRCHRGVRLDLHDGTTLVLADEHDLAPEVDPTYGRDMLMVDAFWASLLGSRLAQWLAVNHVNEI